MVDIMQRHLELNLESFGPDRGVILMRRPLAWYSRGMAGAADFRKQINSIRTADSMRREILSFAAGMLPAATPD